MRHILRHPDSDSNTFTLQEAVCDAMRLLTREETSHEARKDAVSALLVHLCGMSISHYCEEGVQRLARLWLTNPPRVSWQEHTITIERVEAWLRTSARRSESAVRKVDARAHRMLSSSEEDERDLAMRAARGDLITQTRVEETTSALLAEIKDIASGLIARHATRRDQRANLRDAFERLCHIHLVESFDVWLASAHPHVKEPAQQRVLRDRYHQQHSRARRFFHMALLAEPDLDISQMAMQFFAML